MPSNRKALKTYVICGGEFIAGHSAKYCEYCKGNPCIMDNPKKREGRPGPKKKKRVPSGKSIREILVELEVYNKEHGTSLTYGQYIELIEGGK